ncbi:MAG: class I SAM-dependent methyltransferase [Ignavibacteria bacterium]|jgi:SAM-dependent methyltransferase|nr:class I SAM-dependent methyltransferase [Ignavibacteria bacterium]MCU7503122.1 class I SAM-dependent methyltransferase [Ignavibacteria bacterium]MCU7518422.1 class I SAM-dependent methyltransferase [Ignavibacteria bacterium]
MTPAEFFELFEKELDSYNSDSSYGIKDYYKFAQKGLLYTWRKAYLLQRLEYIYENIVKYSPSQVWDVGCGFGTSSLFLAMNGISSKGTTLEWYHKMLPERKKFWNQYGNAELFNVNIENLFEISIPKESADFILVQDTLHHLEPIDEALRIFYETLRKGGKVVVVDDNGNNIMQRMKLYLYRKNNRVIEFYDENLKKKILFGNENVRSYSQWASLFHKSRFEISNVQFIRFFPPIVVNSNNYKSIMDVEKKLWQKSGFLKEYFYWGLDFVAMKNSNK